MAKIKGAIVVNSERCKGCEVCIGSCPQQVIAMTVEVNSKGYHYAFMAKPDSCTGCANCGIVCPDGAISVYRLKSESGVSA